MNQAVENRIRAIVADTQTYQVRDGHRPGQALMNALSDNWAAMSRLLTSTRLDTYYVSDPEEELVMIDKAWDFIATTAQALYGAPEDDPDFDPDE